MEQAKGLAGNNVVTILMKDDNVSLQEAFDLVGLKFKDLMERFLADKGKLRSFGPHNDPSVQHFVTALEHWIIGNLVWSFETQRYFGPQHEEVRRTLAVRLADNTVYDDPDLEDAAADVISNPFVVSGSEAVEVCPVRHTLPFFLHLLFFNLRPLWVISSQPSSDLDERKFEY